MTPDSIAGIGGGEPSNARKATAPAAGFAGRCPLAVRNLVQIGIDTQKRVPATAQNNFDFLGVFSGLASFPPPRLKPAPAQCFAISSSKDPSRLPDVIPLAQDRAFVVQFGNDAPDTRLSRGCVEHVASGDPTYFCSLADLHAFIGGTLESSRRRG